MGGNSGKWKHFFTCEQNLHNNTGRSTTTSFVFPQPSAIVAACIAKDTRVACDAATSSSRLDMSGCSTGAGRDDGGTSVVLLSSPQDHGGIAPFPNGVFAALCFPGVWLWQH